MVKKMRDEYDFSNAVKNPYINRLKRPITININNSTIDYFKDLSKETGIPYQVLINMYLTDCVVNKKRPDISWN